MPTPTRDEAWKLVEEWIESDSLRKHLLGVEAGMRAYARRLDEDEELVKPMLAAPSMLMH